ncbi:MAG: branched-chain amino acid ABC transporter permease [Nitrososphaerota archaeon]|nr:branched-chain amino acid ABC transporter permease [Nitrososphaerota archaeon]
MQKIKGIVKISSKGTLLLLSIISLFIVPLLGERYIVYLMAHVLLLALFATSYNLLFGYSGLLSFGHAGLFAVGAYTCGLIINHIVPSTILAIIGGTAFTAIVSTGIGYLCTKYTRIYFAMLTLAFGMFIYAIVWKWYPVTRGDDGLGGIIRSPIEIPGIFKFNLEPLENYYYFILIVFLLSMIILYQIVRSPFGLILQGIRENDERIEFAGISARKYRFIAFIISGTFSGLTGALYGPLETLVAPSSAHWTKSAEPLLATLLGGSSIFIGPTIGALLFIIIKDIIIRFTEFWLIWFGLILLGLVMGMRGGVALFFQRVIEARFGKKVIS